MNIFFIVGAQKSGTTWLQKQLNDVSGVCCLGEGHFIDKMVGPIAEVFKDYNRMMNMVDERVYEGNGFYKVISDESFVVHMREWILEIMLSACDCKSDKLVAIGDKTPAHSFHMRTLIKLFPEARFIHMLRDGRDVAVSAYHHKCRILNQLNYPVETSLRDEFVSQVKKWGQFTRAVLHSESQGLPVHTVRYESLLEDPFKQLKQCAQFVSGSDDCNDESLQKAVDLNQFNLKSGGRKPGTSDSRSFVRKGVAGSWIQELGEDLSANIEDNDQALLSKLGYSN